MELNGKKKGTEKKKKECTRAVFLSVLDHIRILGTINWGGLFLDKNVYLSQPFVLNLQLVSNIVVSFLINMLPDNTVLIKLAALLIYILVMAKYLFKNLSVIRGKECISLLQSCKILFTLII